VAPRSGLAGGGGDQLHENEARMKQLMMSTREIQCHCTSYMVRRCHSDDEVACTHRKESQQDCRGDEECLELKVKLVVNLDHPVVQHRQVVRGDAVPASQVRRQARLDHATQTTHHALPTQREW
jgi:hypothetical protein